uniref:Uncharacterized protein n=1 Tax=Aegilops tauschii subsp. strangulata TaxID=200361 RepID=A0A453ARZ8_AEGTS
CVAAGALPYLGFGVAWVISAATAGQIVASRAWGESSAPFLFLEALMYGGLKVLIYSILVLVALLALLMCVAYVFALVSGSTSAFKKSALETFTRESVAVVQASAHRGAWIGCGCGLLPSSGRWSSGSDDVAARGGFDVSG